MRIWIPLAALGLLAAVLLFAKEKAAPRQEEKAAEQPKLLIDVNKATVEELSQLPGVGPKLAGRIVKFRDKHGPYRRLEDLLAIQGIGYGKWNAIRPHLRLGTAASEESESQPATGKDTTQR